MRKALKSLEGVRMLFRGIVERHFSKRQEHLFSAFVILVLDQDEAVQDTSQANGWQLVKLADLFVQYRQDGAVERMMYEKAQQEMYTVYAEWLKNHYLAKNNLAAALEMAERIFHKRQWFAEYQKVR
jgi:hypothetical protein